MRVAWSALGFCAMALPPSRASAPAQTVARTARATRFGVADVRRAICVIDFSIPFFINTSTRCEFGFSLVADTTQRMWPPVMSHPNDVGISRQYRPSIPDLYPHLDFLTVWRCVHRETDTEKFFCECVNSMRMNIERRCVDATD